MVDKAALHGGTVASQHEGCGFSVSALRPIYALPVSVWVLVLGKASSPPPVFVYACGLIRSLATHKPVACAMDAIRDLSTWGKEKNSELFLQLQGQEKMQHGIPVSFKPSGVHLQTEKRLKNTFLHWGFYCGRKVNTSSSRHDASCEAMCAGPSQ